MCLPRRHATVNVIYVQDSLAFIPFQTPVSSLVSFCISRTRTMSPLRSHNSPSHVTNGVAPSRRPRNEVSPFHLCLSPPATLHPSFCSPPKPALTRLLWQPAAPEKPSRRSYRSVHVVVHRTQFWHVIA